MAQRMRNLQIGILAGCIILQILVIGQYHALRDLGRSWTLEEVLLREVPLAVVFIIGVVSLRRNRE